MSNNYQAAIAAACLPPLGEWPLSSHDEADRSELARARARLWAAQDALKAAEEELTAALAAIPEFVIRNVCQCPHGEHSHGSWCYKAITILTPPEMGEKTYYPDRLQADREAARLNNQRAQSWQDFLNS